MSFSQELSRIARELVANIVTQEDARQYLIAMHRNQGQMALETKDRGRIRDMVTKAAGSFGKFSALATQMAKSITGPEKAYRRGIAVLNYSDWPQAQRQQAASIFFARAIELV